MLAHAVGACFSPPIWPSIREAQRSAVLPQPYGLLIRLSDYGQAQHAWGKKKPDRSRAVVFKT
jgi:hypothetical protein